MITEKDFKALIEKCVVEAIGKTGPEMLERIHTGIMKSGAFPYMPESILLGAQQFKTAGEQFANHKAVREFAQMRAKNSVPVEVYLPGFSLKKGEVIPPGARGMWVDPETLKEIHGTEKEVRTANGTVAKQVVATQFPSERTYIPFQPFPERKIRIRDLMTVTGIDTPQLEYAQITGYSNTSAAVPELGYKPQASILTNLVVEQARVVAVFIPVSRQATEDVPQLMTYLNQVLEYFLNLQEDWEILNGAGGNDFTGILNRSGIITRAKGGDAEDLTTLRKAVTDLQVAFTDAGFEPTGVVMHPRTWETISLIKDAQNRFLLIPYDSPTGDGVPQPPRVWRVPVVVTPAIPTGRALMGAWDIGAALYVYKALSMAITDSHADWFQKNLLAIRAEWRELLTVTFPKAFVDVSGL